MSKKPAAHQSVTKKMDLNGNIGESDGIKVHVILQILGIFKAFLKHFWPD